MDRATVDHLLTTTRAVRRRLDLERPVETEVIEECLRLAIQAPSGGNTQLWRWLVVTDPGKREQLADLYRSVAGGALEERRAQAAADGDARTERVYDSALYLNSVLDRVPVHVIPCIERELHGSNAEVAGSYGSIIPAAWSFMLALRSRGLGSVWTTLHLQREQEAADLLGIPPGITQIALIPVAYTIGNEFRPAARRPVEEITYWNEWGRSGKETR